MVKTKPTGREIGPLSAFNGSAPVAKFDDNPAIAEHIANMPEEQVMLTVAAQAQVDLRQAYTVLTPKQIKFLHTRALTFTDVEARHLMGKPRPEGNKRPCGCSRHEAGWNDLREQTVLDWKKQQRFMVAYSMLLMEPLLFAASRLESLVPNAVDYYANLIGNPNAKDADRLRASTKVLEAGGLLRQDGASGPHNAVEDSMAVTIARHRMQRGLDLGDDQRELLRSRGYDVPQLVEASVVDNEDGYRSLDGDDVTLD